MILNENFADFIRLLNDYEVRYVMVGGWAVIFEGYERTTSDIDFLVEVNEENAEKILSCIKAFTGSYIGFNKQDLLVVDNVLMIGKPPYRIDLLTSITGVSFEEVFNSSRIYEDDGVVIRCIHINELIRNKKSSGRLKDLLDVEKLGKILAKRNKKK